MNRRNFLASAAGLAVATLVPSWLTTAPRPRRLDLTPFCDAPHAPWKRGCRNYRVDTPFVQDSPIGHGLRRYATDGRICVAVPATADECVGEAVNLPPAGGLAWQKHDTLRGWKRWPRQDYITATDAECPTCDGYGFADEPQECEACQGVGTLLDSTEWGRHPYECEACHGRGSVGTLCPVCNGAAIFTAPCIQPIGGLYIGSRYDGLVRRHLGGSDAVEYVIHTPSPPAWTKPYSQVFFRFAGGSGILMGLDPEASAQRIEKARQGG